MTFVLVKRLLEHLAPARFFALELLDRRADVLDSWWLLVLLVADDYSEFGIDLKRCLATRATHLNQVGLAFRHTQILAHRGAVHGRS